MIEMGVRMVFKVEGMSCHHCKIRIENSLKSLQNIKKVHIDLQRKEILVEGNVLPEEVKRAIASAGYDSVKIDNV